MKNSVLKSLSVTETRLASEQGSSILMILAILVVIGILGSIAARLGAAYVREAKIIEAIGQKSELRGLIKIRTSCPAMLRVSPPTEALLDRHDHRIDGRPRGPMKFGGWTLTIEAWNRSTGVMRISARNRFLDEDSLFESSDPFICR